MIDLLIKNSDGIIKAFWETNFMMAVSILVVSRSLFNR